MRKILLCILTALPCFAIGQTSKEPISKWRNPTKGTLLFKIAIPEGNFFYLNKGTVYSNRFGFLGLSAGSEYYFTDKSNVNFDIGILTDFMIPVPAPVDYFGPYERAFAYYADLQVGRNFKRFHIDAGFQYYKTSYYMQDTPHSIPNYTDTLLYSKHQHQFGISLSTYFRITPTFNIGINYYPAVFVRDENPWKPHYAHLLFLELMFRINASGRK